MSGEQIFNKLQRDTFFVRIENFYKKFLKNEYIQNVLKFFKFVVLKVANNLSMALVLGF